MNTVNPSVVVVASFSEYGVASKDERGIVGMKGQLPQPLLDIQAKLARVANRLQVNLDQPRSELYGALVSAMGARPVDPEAVARPKGPDLSM